MILSRTLTGSLRQPDFWRTRILPALVGLVALGIAYVGALIIGSGGGIDGVNGFVESLSGGPVQP